MSAPPRRLIDDPEAPEALRALLRDTTVAEPFVYDVEDAALRHEKIVASGTAPVEPGELRFEPDAGREQPRGAARVFWWLGGIGAFAALVAGALAFRISTAERAPSGAGEDGPAPGEASPGAFDRAGAMQPTPSRPLPSEQGDLERARQLLETRPADALALVVQGEAEHPESPHSEERRALRVLALARLGRIDEAREHGRAFLAHYARGPFSERVRAAIE